MSLQEKLIMLRKEKKLSQFDVSEALRVSRQAVSRWEAGTAQPSTDNLKVLSKLYEVSVDYLLDEDADRPEQLQEANASENQVAPAKKKFSIDRKTAVAICCAIALLVVLQISTSLQQEKEEPPVLPIGKLTEEDEDNSVDGTFSFLW